MNTANEPEDFMEQELSEVAPELDRALRADRDRGELNERLQRLQRARLVAMRHLAASGPVTREADLFREALGACETVLEALWRRFHRP